MAPPTAAPKSTLRNHRLGKEIRSQDILSAALELFAEKGFAATRLDDIAARAGVSKGTVYLYFSNKEDLFRAVIHEGILPILDQGEMLVAAYPGNSSALLREVLHSWWRLIGSTPLAGVPKLMICEARNFPDTARYYHDHVILRGRRLVAGVLERGMALGEFRPMDIEMAIDLIIAPILMQAIWHFSMAPCCREAAQDPLRYLDVHFDLLYGGLLSGLAPPPGGGRTSDAHP
jgi:AcrR family transcriptional regulator